MNTRGELLPDPKEDPVQILVWCLQTQDKCFPTNGYQGNHVGIIALKSFDITKVGLSSTRNILISVMRIHIILNISFLQNFRCNDRLCRHRRRPVLVFN